MSDQQTREVPFHYLCEGWGETDLPIARICKTRDEVKQFFIDEWMGDADGDELPPVMEEFDTHDWGDGKLHWEFEIGGVSVKRVFLSTPAAANESAEREDGARLLKAAREASFRLSKISEWRKGARAYDAENGNEPRDFCEDVELIEDAAKDAMEQLDAAIDARRK